MVTRRIAPLLGALLGSMLVFASVVSTPTAETNRPTRAEAFETNRREAEAVERSARTEREQTRDQVAHAREQVRKLIKAAIDEHTYGGVILPENDDLDIPFRQNSGWSPGLIKPLAPEGFAAWDLEPPGGSPGVKWKLHRSTAIEGYLDDRLAAAFTQNGDVLNRQTAEGELFAWCAGQYLKDPDPRRRAVACELLAYSPLESIHQGWLAQMVTLLEDAAIAFEGSKRFTDLPPAETRRYELGQAKVGEVAQLSLERIVGIQFVDATALAKWWQDNHEYRGRLWYWRVRAQSHASIAPLQAFEPKLALKLMLLVGSDPVVLSEAAASWPSSVNTKFVSRVQAVSPGRHFSTPEIGHFIRVHNLLPELVRVVQHEAGWLEYPDSTSIELCLKLFKREELPVLLQLLTDSKGALANGAHRCSNDPVSARTKLVRLAIELAPESTEEILLEELTRPASDCGPCLDLIAVSGLTHWDIIKPAVLRDLDHVSEIIRAIAQLKTPVARQALGELLASLNFDPLPDHKASRTNDAAWLLPTLADTAATFAGREVVAKDLLDPTVRRQTGGKGGKLTPKDVEHNANLPEARRVVVALLSDCFKGQ